MEMADKSVNWLMFHISDLMPPISSIKVGTSRDFIYICAPTNANDDPGLLHR